jgi:hypothetical protein
MPVQHFAQPTATTVDPSRPITEIRWDFGYTTIEILEAGQLIAQIRDPNVLLSSGVDITGNNGQRFVLHVKKDVSAGPFAVFRNDIELIGGIPSWGVAPSVAGKLVHLPNDLYQEKLSIRKNLERPVRIAQSWLGFLSLVSIAFAYLSGMGSRFVPARFLSSLDTPLFTGAISALAFMALALAIQKRTAFFVLPIAQIVTIVQALYVGTDLLAGPVYPQFGIFRLFVSALSVWVLIDSWKTVRSHRAKTREARKQNQIGLDEIEKSTVRDLATVAGERGHRLAWQHTQGEVPAASKPANAEPQTSIPSFPSALDLVADGLDPFAPASSDRHCEPLVATPSEGPAQPGWFNRPAPISLQPAAAPGISATLTARPTADPITPIATPALVSSFAPSSASAPIRLAPAVLIPNPADPLPSSLFSLSSSASVSTLSSSNLVTPQGLIGAGPQASNAAPITSPTLLSHAPEPTATLPQPPQPPLYEPLIPEPQGWVPPAAPLPETTESAKPGPSHHPLRSRVRSGL